MTAMLLATAWIGLVFLLRPPRRSLQKMTPRVQAGAALLTMVGVVLVPIAIALVMLKGALGTAGGLTLPSCGRLIWATLGEPWARPDVSLALIVLGGIPGLLAAGAVSAWWSQRACGRIARRGGCRGAIVLSTRAPLAFTAGVLRPRIVLSEGLLALSRPEVTEVVLAHEEAHRRGRHPLVLLVAETLTRAFPITPLRWGNDALRLALELVADDRAVRKTRDRELVAEAVATVALASVRTVPAFEGYAVERVRRLLVPEGPVRFRGFVVAAVLAAVLAFAGAHTGHCAAESAAFLGTSQCRLHR